MPRVEETKRKVYGKEIGYGINVGVFPSNLLDYNAYVKLTSFNVISIEEAEFKTTLEKMLAGDITSNLDPLRHFFLPVPTKGLNMTDKIGIEEGSGFENVLQAIGGAATNLITEITKNTKMLNQTGYTTNQFLSNVFKGMTLRTYDYSWSFIPESPEDSAKLMNMLDMIRADALPSYTKNSPIIAHPNIWLVENRVNGKLLFETNYLIVDSVSIDFDDASGTTFFHDGVPVKTTLNIIFKELFPSGSELTRVYR